MFPLRSFLWGRVKLSTPNMGSAFPFLAIFCEPVVDIMPWRYLVLMECFIGSPFAKFFCVDGTVVHSFAKSPIQNVIVAYASLCPISAAVMAA
jgi:hypothetical protein